MKQKLFVISLFLFVVTGVYSQKATRPSVNKTLRNTATNHHDILLNRLLFANLRTPANELYDSIYHWTIDSISGKWVVVSRVTDLLYNSNKDILRSVQQRLENQVWVNSSKSMYTYDALFNEEEEVLQVWNNNAWNNSFRTLNVYNGSKRIQYIYQQWEGNAWLNLSKHIENYSGDTLTSTLDQLWNPAIVNWENLYQFTFSYFNTGKKKTEDLAKWGNNSWTVLTHADFSYDSLDRLKIRFFEDYQPPWKTTRDLYQYDSAGNMVENIQQALGADSITWSNAYRWADAYTSDSIIEKYYDWNDTISNWNELEKTSIHHDSNGNIKLYLREALEKRKYILLFRYVSTRNPLDQQTDLSNITWNDSGTVITSSDSIHYFFKNITGIHEDKINTAVRVYPNPSNGSFAISLENKKPIKTIELYTILGERMFLQPDATETVSLTDPSKGIYFIKVSDGERIYTKKIIIQ